MIVDGDEIVVDVHDAELYHVAPADLLRGFRTMERAGVWVLDGWTATGARIYVVRSWGILDAHRIPDTVPGRLGRCSRHRAAP